jgi:hypothetical protein
MRRLQVVGELAGLFLFHSYRHCHFPTRPHHPMGLHSLILQTMLSTRLNGPENTLVNIAKRHSRHFGFKVRIRIFTLNRYLVVNTKYRDLCEERPRISHTIHQPVSYQLSGELSHVIFS